MRAGISSEKSSIRRSGIAVTGMVTAGSRRQPCCHACRSARVGELILIVLHANLHRIAGKPQLSCQLDGGIERVDLGRKRIGAVGCDDDHPPAPMRNRAIDDLALSPMGKVSAM